MKKYKSYHSSVKICYALGIENHLLPNEFLASIKPSTAHYWKHDNPDKYVGAPPHTLLSNQMYLTIRELAVT